MVSPMRKDTRIVKHGPKVWRVEARDACGSWDVTGPPFDRKLDATVYAMDEAWQDAYFGKDS